MTPSFHTQLKKVAGKMIFPDGATEKRYKAFMAKIPEGEEVKIEVTMTKEDYTLKMVRYCNTLIRLISKETGDDFESTKNLMKCKVGLCINYKVKDEYKEFIISLADLDKEDMLWVITQFESYATEAGVFFGEKWTTT